MNYGKVLAAGALVTATLGAYKIGGMHEKQNLEAKDLVIKDAEKFAKEFTTEQFNTFESQMKSLIGVTRLLKQGDIKGVFTNYAKPIDWIKFATDMHSNSLSHKSAESILNTCIAKICGTESEQFKYITTALSNEYGSIMMHANESKFKITNTSKSLVKLSIESNDHTTSIFQAGMLIKKFAEEVATLNDAAIEKGFNDFVRASVSHTIPELHQQYDSSE